MAARLFTDEIVETEETLYYWLFPYDSKWTPVTEEEKLKDFALEYMAFLHPYIQDYIWENESFSLGVRLKSCSDSSGGLRSYIGGTTIVKDNLEDEWFVVFLLITLTKAFPRLVCRVFDNDGEFLLIEAALHAPSWANPETAEQRVYLREGSVHLVPPSVLPLAPDPSSPQIAMAAVGHVIHLPTATLANPAIQSAISLRIEDYPRKISREQHSSHAYVPVGVAALLHEYPTLVSAAVRTFCNRDVLDNKCLRVMRHFPPETRVMTSVRFSKALYAVLSAHSFTPDSRTGWNIPLRDNNAHVIGMKLACGFEILVCRAGGVTPSSLSLGDESDEAIIALDNNPQWIKYKGSLKENGYFRGELEGSKLFRELEENARRFFMSNKMLSRGKEDEFDTLPVGSIVIKLLSKINADYDAFKQREKLLSPPDDEKWLHVTPDALDEMLESKFQTGNIKNQAKSQQEIADSLNAFLKHASSYEGAEIPEELRPKPNTLKAPTGSDRKKSSSNGPKKLSGLLNLHHPQHRKISSYSNASDSSEMSSLSAKVDFNADSFTDALNNILELSVPEDEYFNGGNEDSSGMSSYEDDDEGDLSLSRKTSDGSGVSKASSGVDADVAAPQRPPRSKKSKCKTAKKIPLAYFDDFDDFDDEEEEDAAKAVTQLLQTYREEGGEGPTTSLLASLGLNPPKQ